MDEKDCGACAYNRLALSREVRRNEARLARGKPVDLAEINRTKEHMAQCAERGHHKRPSLKRQAPTGT